MNQSNDIEHSSKIENENDNLASRRKRLFASIIDTLFMMLGTVPFMYFTGGFENINKGIETTFLYTTISGLIGTLVFIIFNIGPLLSKGQTLGKEIFHIKIVDLDNKLPSKRNLFNHYLPYLGFPYLPVVGGWVSIIDALFIFRQDKRCIHNLIGKTKVVNC